MLVKEKIKTFWEIKYKLLLALITLLSTQLSSVPFIKALNEFLKWLANDDDDDPMANEYT